MQNGCSRPADATQYSVRDTMSPAVGEEIVRVGLAEPAPRRQVRPHTPSQLRIGLVARFAPEDAVGVEARRDLREHERPAHDDDESDEPEEKRPAASGRRPSVGVARTHER